MKQEKKYFLILFLSIFFLSCYKKEEKNNLIEFIDSEKYALFSKEDKAFFLDSISKKMDELPNDSITKNLAFKISAEYYYLKDNDKSFELSKKAYDLSVKQADSVGIGRALYYMGDCYELTKKDSAYYYYKEAEKIFKLINNEERLAKVYFNKAYLLFYEGNYVESEIEVIKALKNLKNSTNYKLKYSCYTLQGSIHNELEEYDKALAYFKLAEDAYYNLIKQNNDVELIYDYYVLNVINLCNIYDKKGEYQKSINAFSNVDLAILKDKWPNLYLQVLGNLAYSKMKNGNLKEAKKLFEITINLSKENKLDRSYLYKILNYGEFNLITKDTTKAKKYFMEAFELSKKFKSGKEVLKSLDFLSKVDREKTSYYKNEYIKVSDSIIKEQRASSNKFARIEYETDKLEDANKVLTKRNFYLFVGGVLLLIVFLILLFLRHKKAQQREIEFLEQKNAADDELFEIIKDYQLQLVKTKENVQNRIAKELHDGVMNNIYSVRLNLGFLNGSNDESMKEKRLIYITELQKIEKEIRNLSHDLSHETDFVTTDFGYLLNNLVESINQISSIIYSSTFDSSIKWDDYSSVIKINIYRILQELCSNVNKYSKANYCKINIREKNNILFLNVEDDGIGFDTAQNSNGIGMKNMQQRIKTISGKIKFISSSGNGCKVEIEIKKK